MSLLKMSILHPSFICMDRLKIQFNSLYSAKKTHHIGLDIYTKITKEIIYNAWSPEGNPNKRACMISISQNKTLHIY